MIEGTVALSTFHEPNENEEHAKHATTTWKRVVLQEFYGRHQEIIKS